MLVDYAGVKFSFSVPQGALQEPGFTVSVTPYTDELCTIPACPIVLRYVICELATRVSSPTFGIESTSVARYAVRWNYLGHGKLCPACPDAALKATCSTSYGLTKNGEHSQDKILVAIYDGF